MAAGLRLVVGLCSAERPASPRAIASDGPWYEGTEESGPGRPDWRSCPDDDPVGFNRQTLSLGLVMSV